MAVLTRALLLAALLAPAGCYSPRQPPCAFSCADDGVCPSGFTCGTDGVCHRDDSTGTCDIPSQVDAAQDSAQDADADGGAADGDTAD